MVPSLNQETTEKNVDIVDGLVRSAVVKYYPCPIMLKEMRSGTSFKTLSDILSPSQEKCLCCYVKSYLILSHLSKNCNGLAICLSSFSLDVSILDFLMRNGRSNCVNRQSACMRIRLKQSSLLIMCICEMPHISVPASKITKKITCFCL